MAHPYYRGDRALERLGELTKLIARVAEENTDLPSKPIVLDGLIGEMGDALNERNLEKAKKIMIKLLSDILGYEKRRAEFVMNNHLNKNSGW